MLKYVSNLYTDMKKIVLIFVLMSVLTACTKDLTKLNVNPKLPSKVPSYSLFTESERVLDSSLYSASENLNIFRLIEQQWTETTYLNETNYQITYRKQPDAIWSEFYTGILINLEKAKSLMATDVTDAGTRKNEAAIADIMEVYTYFYLVTTFGNIPYTQALNIDNPFPAYDDQKTIYYALLTRLDADIAAISASAGSYGSADIVYGGNPASWIKFGNTLKLKMGIIIADYDNTTAKTTVEAAVAAGVFTSNNDNAEVKFVTTPPNNNPIWGDLVQSGRHDYVGTSGFINLMNPGAATQDPRLPYYFAPSIADSVFVGADNGSGDGGIVFSQYSLPSGPLLTPGSVGTLTNPDFPGILLDYSETEFYLAEGAARGYNVGGTVESHYNNAITASIEFWTGSAAGAPAYLLQPNVAYATATGGTALQKIALQAYISFYNRGWEAWIESRRLDYPVLLPPPNAVTAFPVRFTYPINEQNVNVVNYNKASTAIGGDLVTTKLFFDLH
jgi:hypothetical protein